jgi:hypothetical protein
MSVGSHGQQRAHPCMAAIRLMSTESRLMEIQLGPTPVAESRAGITKELPPLSIDEQIQGRRAYLRPADDDGTATIWSHDRDLRKFNGIMVIPTPIAGLPGATRNRHHRAQPSRPELDGNRRVGIVGERTQRRRAVGAQRADEPIVLQGEQPS